MIDKSGSGYHRPGRTGLSVSQSRAERAPRTAGTVVASFPAPISRNPYQTLLYGHLRAEGIEVDAAPQLNVGWLWHRVGRVAVLHFHWPQEYYRYHRGGLAVRLVLSWVRGCLFVLRIVVARLLAYRIVWTVHQIFPHETESRALDRLAGLSLARVAHALVTHDQATAEAVTRELHVAPEKVHVIPHGSYLGVYPGGRSREEMRSALGIRFDAFVVLCFGQVRRYKELTFLMEAFDRAGINGGVLLIVGLPLDPDEARRLKTISRRTTRVVTVLEYVPDNRVAEFFAASDVFCSARLDGGTSGALVLALSLGLPVVAARCPAYVDLTDQGKAGWLFEPGSSSAPGFGTSAGCSRPGGTGSQGRLRARPRPSARVVRARGPNGSRASRGSRDRMNGAGASKDLAQSCLIRLNTTGASIAAFTSGIRSERLHW